MLFLRKVGIVIDRKYNSLLLVEQVEVVDLESVEILPRVRVVDPESSVGLPHPTNNSRDD